MSTFQVHAAHARDPRDRRGVVFWAWRRECPRYPIGWIGDKTNRHWDLNETALQKMVQIQRETSFTSPFWLFFLDTYTKWFCISFFFLPIRFPVFPMSSKLEFTEKDSCFTDKKADSGYYLLRGNVLVAVISGAAMLAAIYTSNLLWLFVGICIFTWYLGFSENRPKKAPKRELNPGFWQRTNLGGMTLGRLDLDPMISLWFLQSFWMFRGSFESIWIYRLQMTTVISRKVASGWLPEFLFTK